MFRLLGIAMALALAAGPASAASPLWGSDQVRRSRPLEDVQALVFELRRQVTGSRAEDTTQTVTLAPTFTYIVSGRSHILEDHQTCNAFAWSDGDPAVASLSCYANVAFRLYEIRNRAYLDAVNARLGVKFDKAQTQYWAEQELGVLSPSDRSPTKLIVRGAADGAEYRLGGLVMARVQGSAGDVSADEMRRVVRFFFRDAKLHPKVRDDLAAGARLPAVIETETGPIKPGEGRMVMTLSNLHRASVAYPLPAGLKSALAEAAQRGTTPRDEAVRRVQAVLAGRAPGPTLEATMAAMRAAVAERRMLDATLIFMQLTQEQKAALRQGPSSPALDELRRLLPEVMAAPESQAFMEASSLAGDAKAAGDRQAAARYLATAKLDDRPFGTFRYVTYANLLAVSDTKGWDPAIAKAMPVSRVDNYWTHIAAHPWSSNAYKDAGDAYYLEYEMGEAWTAFDLGREVDLDWRSGPMSTVADFEQTMRSQFPGFF